jgi:hypothetical protein
MGGRNVAGREPLGEIWISCFNLFYLARASGRRARTFKEVYMDSETITAMATMATMATAFGSAEFASKLLGPTIEYFGNGLKDIVALRISNLQRISKKAEKRFPKDVDESKLALLNPLMIKDLIDYGSFIEDELIQEYFAGLLISSRIGLNNDNRGVVFSSILKNLSVYQIRCHYLIYSLLRKKYVGSGININIQRNRFELQTYIPYSIINKYLFSSDEEKALSNGLIDHAIHGLRRNDLIEPNIVIGSPDHIASEIKSQRPSEHGIVIQPGAFGIELFLWISSIGKNIQMNMLLDPKIVIPEFLDFSQVDFNKIYRYPY